MRKVAAFTPMDDPQLGLLAARALAGLADQAKGKCLRLQEINGQSALHSPIASLLREAGFRDDYNGLMMLGSVYRPSPSVTPVHGLV